jgi:hypothetical protein
LKFRSCPDEQTRITYGFFSAFIREKTKPDEPATPVKNYITPSGLERRKDERRFLLTRKRLLLENDLSGSTSRSCFGVA